MMKYSRIIFVSLFLGILTLPIQAQKRSERSYIRSGNKAYKDSVWNKAEIKYRKAIDLNPASNDARYNLGNTLYNSVTTDTVQGDRTANEILDEVIESYINATKTETDDMKLAQAYHNLGNAYYLYGAAQYSSGVDKAKETLANSIMAYKESLRRNPSDNEERFNLAKAKVLYNSVPTNPQDQNQDQEQQQNQDQQQQQPEPPSEKDISEDNAEQILQMLMQDEKDLQEKVQQMQQQQGKKLDKDW